MRHFINRKIKNNTVQYGIQYAAVVLKLCCCWCLPVVDFPESKASSFQVCPQFNLFCVYSKILCKSCS